MRKPSLCALALAAGLVGASAGASAAVINSDLGNTTPGFADGSIQPAFLVGGVQGGQPAPFNASIGNDALGPDFSASWQHIFGPIADPILSATLTIGIYDHDSSASGSQVGQFSADGNALTGDLDALFEAGGGAASEQYNEYTLDLFPGLFPALVDGILTVSLDLAGPGLVPTLFPLPGPNPPTETNANGANLIFSSLQITTQDPGVPQLPTPATIGLLGLGLAGLGWRRRRPA